MAGYCANDVEKSQELDALLAIYEGDFLLLAGTDSSVIYQINLENIHGVVEFNIHDSYPDNPPTITVRQNDKNIIELEEVLTKRAVSLKGEVMIHNLIEEAKQWAYNHRLEFSKNKENPDNKMEEQAACKFFLLGQCRYGEQCFNKHITGSTQPSTTAAVVVEIKPEKHKEEATDVKHESKGSKKAPMKTSTDVISRILWDKQLNKDDFCVGYLDRFIGVLERPFTEFSWEDLASVDYNVLAIPKHRIQYFKYRGNIVWDKRERIDDVFGSTGSGTTILDVLKENPSADNGVNGNQSEEKSEMFLLEELERNDEAESQVRNSKTGKTSGPNYFLAVKVCDPEIVNHIQEFQCEVVKQDPLLSDSMTQPQHLHVTLLMLTLPSPQQVALATEVLKGLRHALTSITPSSYNLKFKAVGSFRDRILYIGVENSKELRQLVKMLRLEFLKAGVQVEANRDEFQPHLTVCRASKMMTSHEKCSKVFSYFAKTYRNTLFGSQCIDSLGLFSRVEKENGTHKCVYSLENTIFNMLPKLFNKIQSYLERLANENKITDQGTETLLRYLDERDGANAERALELLSEIAGSSSRAVIIMRGIPGCGKSFLLDHCIEAREPNGLEVCSPKQLFYRAGNNKVDKSDLNIAEAFCRTRFLEAITGHAQYVALDDCHPHVYQYSLYRKLARAFGLACHVLEITCPDHESVQRCGEVSGRNASELAKMRGDWDEDSDAVRIDPWFKNPSIQDTPDVSLRSLLGL